MKLLMMGTGPFAVPSFQRLVQSRHEVVCLITRPDKLARGRKHAPPNPMRDAAQELGIQVFAPGSINAPEGLDLLDQQATDLFVVCDYGQILSSDALSRARLGGINLHGSLLPKYRGAAPINWALLRGDKTVGITVIHMTPRLDGGPILCQRSIEVGDHEDAVQLEDRLSKLGVDAVLESVDQLEQWDGVSSIGWPQDKELVTRAPRLKKSDGLIDWSQSAEAIFNQVRALKPWPGTYTNLLRSQKDPLRVLVHDVRVYEGEVEGEPGEGRDAASGIVVKSGCGAVLISSLQPTGKRKMDSGDFVRGYGATLRFGGD